MELVTTLLSLLLLTQSVISVPRDLLYPYGPEAFDRQLPNEDEGASPEIELTVPIAFFDEIYNSIYVNINGILSFVTEIPNFFNVQFPLEYPVIAPLYTDVDIRGGGAVYYRETQEETLLRRASETIVYAFSKGQNFRATSLFIVTWQDVGYFENGSDKANTFQVVIASSGEESYVFLLYADHGVQWIQGKGKSSRPDARAQAGIISGDGRMVALRGSGTDQVLNLDNTEYANTQVATSCLRGVTECHSKAQCIDYRPGFCCLCQDGFYGNGRNCLQDEIPLRVNGKVTGSLNNVRLEEMDLQSYVVTTDGRTYTAISRVPEELGIDMQSLNVLGTSIAWLFAKPIKSSKNGYELTGGVYNHTTELTFPQSGHRVTVLQRFFGLDVFDQLRTEVTINGHVPAIPPDTRIEMDDYEEKLTRVSPGVVKSYFTRKLRMGGEGGLEVPMTVDQTMEYEECAAHPPDVTTLRLKHNRNYILYESREKIVRFAMTSKITPLGELPSCTDVRCHPAAECIELPSGVPECRCRDGFTGNGLQCHPDKETHTPGGDDTNSCHIAHNCSPYAACNFDGPSYSCVCLPGYQGDGYSCEASTVYHGHGTPRPTCLLEVCWCPAGFQYEKHGHSCETITDLENTTDDDIDEDADDRTVSCNVLSNCHPHAQCIYKRHLGQYRCECNAGYEGDGYECSEIELSCSEVDICHMNASCVSDSQTGKYICTCNPGLDGDGTSYCYPSGDCNSLSDCSSNAQCLYNHVANKYQCLCNVGFNGDGRTCELDREGACGRCHEYAECQYRQDTRQFQCECQAGYVGDGRSECEREKPGCNVLNDCGNHAECAFNQREGGYRCRCRDGYKGDGHRCVPSITCDQDRSICDENAECIPENRQYVCRCRDGFAGDGLTCRAAQSHEGQFLLLNQGMATLRIPFKPTFNNRGRPIQIQYYQTAVGIDIDCLEGRVYWGDVNGKTIKSCKYDGADRENFLAKDIGAPEGVAVDWISRNIYWTDSTLKRVEVASIDLPRRRKVLVSEGLVNPRGIAIHAGQGKLFWSDWNRESPKIEQSNMDGSSRTIIVREGLQLPNSLAVDIERDELCWADAGTKNIACIGIRNNFRRTVVSECSYPFGLAISNSHYYWTDWATKKVESAARPTGELLDALEVPLGGSGSLFGIVAVPDKCPRLSNACQADDPCPEGYLCLPNGRGGRSCVCSEGEEGAQCNDIV
ncbi:hypothetical protein B566_EDAN005442 [Ephemera danica]|nr:hypothetical protein B566_EDAN005442 [Ephemera danica]